jgi:ABC-2 type transport system permease protein
MRRAIAIARKEFRQMSRDRRTMGILLLVPAFFLLLFGYALSFDIRHVGLAIEDRDNTVTSRRLVAAFVHSGYFDVVATGAGQREIDMLFDWNRARAALVIPEGVERDLLSGGNPAVQILINGDNANAAATVVGYGLAIVRETTGAVRLELGAVGGAAAAPISVETRVWYNPELQSALFLVPGLIAFIIMIAAVISTALSIVKEKEKGTWEQVRMSPVSTASYVVGKTIPYFLVSIASSLLIILIAMALFGLPMRGSWFMLGAATCLFLLGALGTGLFISTLASSQALAFQMALIVALLPTFILSGFVFPIASMPAAVQAVTYLVPARYFLSALRSIVLKGAEVGAYADQLIALAGYAAVVLVLSSLRLATERE